MAQRGAQPPRILLITERISKEEMKAATRAALWSIRKRPKMTLRSAS